MPYRNTASHYGRIAIILHWLMAILFIFMFFLGDYMVDLGYYHEWRQLAPWLHRSIGVITLLLLVMRFLWKINNIEPKSESHNWQHQLSKITHWSFYVGLLLLSISGYLISTAKGAGFEVFNWFEVPALITLTNDNAEIIGEVHEIIAKLLMLLMIGHAFMALKHHIVDKDSTLNKMLPIIKPR